MTTHPYVKEAVTRAAAPLSLYWDAPRGLWMLHDRGEPIAFLDAGSALAEYNRRVALYLQSHEQQKGGAGSIPVT